MYHFTPEDFRRVLEHPLFQRGHELLMETTLNSDQEWFHVSEEFTRLIQRVPRSAYYRGFRKYSLLFLSPCRRDLPEIMQKLKRKLLTQATDPTRPAWWCYLYGCGDVGFFIIYPMIRILYLDLAIYAVWCHSHYYLVTAPRTWPMELVKQEYSLTLSSPGLTRDVSRVVVWDIINFNLNPYGFSYFHRENCTIELVPEDEITSHYLTYWSSTNEKKVREFAKILRN